MRLNESQRVVASHVDGPLAVIALAGSGKTAAIVERCASLVLSGVAPERILAVTFSRDGAGEMNRRLLKLLGETKMRVGTFHSVGLQILTQEIYRRQQPEVANGRYEIAVKILLNAYKKEIPAGLTGVHEVVMSYISLAKAKGIPPDTEDAIELAKQCAARIGFRLRPEWLHAIYVDVEKKRHKEAYITYDDMLFDTVLHFRANEKARIRWASRWDYLIQDEAQDQNLVQHELCDQLAREHRQLMKVGDVSQTIHAWRGADPNSLNTFVTEYGAKVVRMEHNYRSGPRILAFGERILHTFGLDPHAKFIVTREHTDSVRGIAFDTEQAEASFIVDEVQHLIADGVRPHDIAILIRTGLQSLPFEGTLAERKIPFHLAIGKPFYKRRDVATLLSYLRILTKTETVEDWEIALKRPTKYLTLDHIGRIVEAAKRADYNDSTFTVVRQAQRMETGYAWNYAREWAVLIDELMDGDVACANAAEILKELVDKLRYTEFLAKEGEFSLDDESLDQEHILLVQTLLKRAKSFTVVELLRDVEETLKQTVRRAQAEGRVSLTTVHRAKGLEWQHVYVAGVTKGYFPHSGTAIQDEARVFYVGVTRARDTLTVTGTGGLENVSQFLKLVPGLGFRHGLEEATTTTIDDVKYRVVEDM